MALRSVDAIEAGNADFVVCARPADLVPISRLPKDAQPAAAEAYRASTRERCGKCGTQIVVSATAPAGIPRICPPCHEAVRQIAIRASR